MNRTLPFEQGFLPLLNLDFLRLTKLFCTPPDGRIVSNLSPCQTLDSKAVYTLKSKSTNNLYVMLSAPAPDRPPPDGDDEEEDEHESEVRFFFPS